MIPIFQLIVTNWSILYRGKLPLVAIANKQNKQVFMIIRIKLLIYNYKKKTIAANTNDKKTNVSIKANPINVVLKIFSTSSGFLETAKLYEANKIPVPNAPPAIGNIQNPKTKILAANTINM